MAIIDLLKSCNFKIILKNNKSIELMVQEVNLPGFTIGQIDIPRPNVYDKRPGDHLDYNDLMLTVLCDEELKAFKEVYNAIELSSNPRTGRLEIVENIFEGVLFVTSNKNNIKTKAIFHDAWIKSVDDLTLSTTTSEDEQVTFSMTICYNYYTLE